MKRYFLLIYLLINIFFSFAQEKKFSSFELVYDIPQQVSESSQWPKSSLKGIQIYNDTLFTLLIRENCMTSFTLSGNSKVITDIKLNLDKKVEPISLVRIKNKWFFITATDGIFIYNKKGPYNKIINEKKRQRTQTLYCINNHLLTFSQSGFSGEGFFNLYNMQGNILDSIKCESVVFSYPFENNNIIKDGYLEVMEKDSTLKISLKHPFNAYPEEDTFVGGYQNSGYFIDWYHRNKLIIRDLSDTSIKEQFFIPVKFDESDLGIPEEELINLRVFSQDNNTFYFVTLKHGHLLIYKATR